MPKIEVILISNIVGLGAESDQVKVAAGYARNYLLPQHLAIPLTGANKRRIEALRQRRAERESNELNSMSELSKSISKLTCIVKVKTGDDGKLFGSVTTGAIADELKHQFDITLDKKKIHLEHPIKATGDYNLELRLHPDVTSTLKVRVESTTPIAQLEAAAAEVKARETAQRTEKRGHRFDDRGPAPARGEKPERPARAAAAADKPAKGEKPAKAEKPA